MFSSMLDRLHPTIPPSQLHNENSFYPALLKDIKQCRSELIIESAYMTTKRVYYLLPYLKVLKKNRVRIVINTRNPEEYDLYLRDEARKCLALLLEIGVQVIFSESLNRKTAIIDRNILWEGSLNILSQNNCQEVMCRTESAQLGWQMIKFSGIDQKIS